MSQCYNSNGSPVRGWDHDVEEETPLQRIRRRYQQRRCLACGAAERRPRHNFCGACYDAGWRYCAMCEQVKEKGEFWALSRCKPCQLARQYPDREGAAEREREAARRGHLAQRAAVADAQQQLLALRDDRGWTVRELSRFLSAQEGRTVTPRAVRMRIIRARKVVE